MEKIIKPIKMAQYGTKHAHASGVLQVMLENPNVDVVGVYEPDSTRRKELETLNTLPWNSIKWFDDKSEILEDTSIVAVSSEGLNAESLSHTEQLVDAGKHVFYDKPAGDDYRHFERVVAKAKEQNLLIQLGYMFRYHDGFTRISEWARSGVLGQVFAIRAHMSTTLTLEGQKSVAVHKGGTFYDLAGHVLDQIIWILGRPEKVTSFMRRDISPLGTFTDNSLAVFEYDSAMATIDIAAMEPSPTARRFEVYGDRGSAIMEPFEPANTLRLCLVEARDSYPSGVSTVKLEDRRRYVASLEAFVSNLVGEKSPDRSLDHELLVQETLLRATGRIPT